MNRTSWIIIGITCLIVSALGFFYIKPVVTSSWGIYVNVSQTKQELEEVNKRKEILSNLSQNNQLNQIYDLAAKYIPTEPKSGELVIELTAIAEQANLKIETISLESEKEDKTEDAESEKTSSNTSENSSNQPTIQKVPFSLTVVGGFSDFLKFLIGTETSSRLISIHALTLTQEKETFTAQIKGESFWAKESNQERNLANIEITPQTIEKFLNLKTYGTPINLPSESGFGRENPFENY